MAPRFDYFVVFAEMRTGSNLLEANLNAFDEVSCLGEAFNLNFIGYPNQDSIEGVTMSDRDADPVRLLSVFKSGGKGLRGFRYFHDHEPRVLDEILADPRCAKIILTRNPVDSYVSLKIAQETGQWKLTNIKSRKSGKATFDAEEFDHYLESLQDFQLTLLNGLQRTGQTAFYLAYEDLQDLDVINGVAAFLGLTSKLDALSTTLKVQNPAALSEKVSNFAQMERALAEMDQYNLARTPNFEPRRGASVPSYFACEQIGLLFMPIPGGPTDAVKSWMQSLPGSGDMVERMTQKRLRHWKRNHSGHRSFTVLRHPLHRAYQVFCDKIISDGSDNFPQVRRILKQKFGMPVPSAGGKDWSKAQHRDAFARFLTFLKANLAGQTGVRVDASWATQSAVLQGFANINSPDQVIREDELASDLPQLASRVGITDPTPFQAEVENVPFPLSGIYDEEIERLALDAYQRDYMMFGFAPWRKA